MQRLIDHYILENWHVFCGHVSDMTVSQHLCNCNLCALFRSALYPFVLGLMGKEPNP